MPAFAGQSFTAQKIHQQQSQEDFLLPTYKTADLTLTEEPRLHSSDFELQGLNQNPQYKDEELSPQTPKSPSSEHLVHSVVTDKISQSQGPYFPESSHNLYDTPMGRNSPKTNVKDTLQTSSVGSGSQNGVAKGEMNENIEMRRKLPPRSPTQSSDFTLDNAPLTPQTPTSNTSFLELPRQDRRNFMLLVLLYFLQGVPMGLAGGSVPFLLKSHLSYGQIGIFTLASYPYSLKLLWSPIVDAVWSPIVGRRKSWILPIQLCSGFGMLYMGGRAEKMMVAAGAADGSGVWTFTWWWFFLVFLCATQDIAVDGNLHVCIYEQV